MPSKKTLAYIDPSVIAFGYVFANQAGVGRGLVHADRTDVNPRFGVAYRVTNNSVIRGGYGLFTPTSTAHIIRDPLATNTFNQTYTKRTVAGGPPISGWPTGGDSTGTSPNAGGPPPASATRLRRTVCHWGCATRVCSSGMRPLNSNCRYGRPFASLTLAPTSPAKRLGATST